jgi:monoamine oxidase
LETILVTGAGAAGLTAAYELAKNNKKVIVAEASDRLGGRIHTISNSAFSAPIELGAEFVHGKMKHTLRFLKKAGIHYHAVKGKMLYLQHGEVKKEHMDSKQWDQVMKQMKHLKNDQPFADFLQEYFHEDKYEEVRESVKRYARGFDLADITRVSTKFLYKEWSHEDSVQYRIDGGYQKLVDYLAAECKKYGCDIYTNCCVQKINWQRGEVNITTTNNRRFKAKKMVVTVPIGVLQAETNDPGYLEFTPAIDTYLRAAKNIGFGTVIKIMIEFDELFWQQKNKYAGFIFTDEKIPTWWSQLPKENCLLTGWLGGAGAPSFNDASEEELLEEGLKSLSSAFAIELPVLRDKVKAYKIVNWKTLPNISGGYSYNTPQSIDAKNLLNTPVEETIYFAGEGLHNGMSPGTVEAAIISGKEAAFKILKKKMLL